MPGAGCRGQGEQASPAAHEAGPAQAGPANEALARFLALCGGGAGAAEQRDDACLMRDLRAALDAAAARLWRGEPSPGAAEPALLLDAAAALAWHAQPRRQKQPRQGAAPGETERAAAALPALRSLLVLVEAASRRPVGREQGGALAASLRQVCAWLYVSAVTHLADEWWSDPGTRRTAEELLQELLRVSACRSVPGFLRGDREGDEGRFAEVLDCLQPELTKETWKHNPATKHVFSWTLQQITRPWLGHHLEQILPPSLMFSDDYQLENKILGVECLHHIIQNVPAAELCQLNRVEVVHHALFNHLYSREPQLIKVVLLSLLDLLPIMERASQWLPHDHRFAASSGDILQLLLLQMEAEHLVSLRRVYASCLPVLVERLGIQTASYLKRLQRVIVAYLEVADGPEEAARLAVLETLKRVIEHVWPRMPCRLPVLLKALLRLMWDVTTDRSATPDLVKSTLLQESTECLLLLDRSCHGQAKVQLQGVYQSCQERSLREHLRMIVQEPGLGEGKEGLIQSSSSRTLGITGGRVH